MEFELIENSKITKYKYFGETRSMGGMDLGIDVNYPDEMTKEGWYDKLIGEFDCMAAATLGYLYHVGESYGDIDEIVCSQLYSDFIKKYLADGYFSEPYFIDGEFGRFSNYGELAYPESEEDGKSYEFTWTNESIRMKFKEKCIEGDWKEKIFIDPTIENEFKSHLNTIIELFNPDSNL
jgi:hypothetical protein